MKVRVVARNYHDVLLALSRLGFRAKDILCDKLYWSPCGKELEVGLVLKFGTAYSTNVAVEYSNVDIGSHTRSVKVSLHGVIHTTLSRMIRKRRIT